MVYLAAKVVPAKVAAAASSSDDSSDTEDEKKPAKAPAKVGGNSRQITALMFVFNISTKFLQIGCCETNYKKERQQLQQ